MNGYMKKIRQYFISGLAVIAPVVLTLYVIGLLLHIIEMVIGRYLNGLIKLIFGFSLPGLNIALSILLIVFIGMMVQNFIARRVVEIFEGILKRMPLIGKIYFSVKKIADYFFPVENSRRFGKVVLIEYPRKGLYCIGFLSSEGIYLPLQGHKEMVAVFVPTSPSPLTGFLEFVWRDEIIPLDISVEDALQTIVSGGVVIPEAWKDAENENRG